MKKRGSQAELALPSSPADILLDLDAQPVQIDGSTMSRREAHLKIVYARALKGDPKASKQLQEIREACGLDQVGPRPGCLVVPEPPSLEAFERMAFEQQRQFREKPHSEDSP